MGFVMTYTYSNLYFSPTVLPSTLGCLLPGSFSFSRQSPPQVSCHKFLYPLLCLLLQISSLPVHDPLHTFNAQILRRREHIRYLSLWVRPVSHNTIITTSSHFFSWKMLWFQPQKHFMINEWMKCKGTCYSMSNLENNVEWAEFLVNQFKCLAIYIIMLGKK